MEVHLSKLANKKTEDALSQLLNSMRVSGSLLLQEHYITPWAVSIPPSAELSSLLNVSDNIRIAAFHLVEQGQVFVSLENGDKINVQEGELLICFSGLGHVLSQGESKNIIDVQELMSGAANSFKPDESELGVSTSLICGIFFLKETLFNPLLLSLPSVLKVSIKDNANNPRLYGVNALLKQEFKGKHVANDYVVSRYLELLCAEAIRSYVDELLPKTVGWLSGLKDPIVGQAIEVIHSQLDYHWTVKKLAAHVMLSPSRFAARFSLALGESPMVYVTKQRMSAASIMLEDKEKTIEQIANCVGYENLAAFSRAFKRYVGLPPATWRSQINQ